MLLGIELSMRHSRYKYFSKMDYAHQFLDGNMFCQTLAFFRDYEDAAAQQIIGDEYEGTRLYRPANGLEIHNHSRGTNGNVQMGMESSTRAHEIYVFCVSMSLTEELKKEFKAVACVEICDPREFIARWHAALPNGATHAARKIGYYRPEDIPGNVWALPDLIATTKLKRFSYQDEYRFAYTRTEAFGFQNCVYGLVDRKARPMPTPEEHHHETLNLSNLSNICRLLEFSP
jgi:hypothetical protein